MAGRTGTGQTAPAPGLGAPSGASVPAMCAMVSGSLPVTPLFPVARAVPASHGGIRPWGECRPALVKEKCHAQILGGASHALRHIRHTIGQCPRGATTGKPLPRDRKRAAENATTLSTRYPIPAVAPGRWPVPTRNSWRLSASGTREIRGRCESSPSSCLPCCRPASRRGRPARRWHGRSGSRSRS